ncbi:BCCT family transporter [Bacillus sp. DTU_2020_1000418_1_SI_GHA_SEK_038]|uniref:BCCT family transporter n=1 Tax=Bacillus sp. DTU_2020_1000418_1_SI_GHA_SEK_038 TaxID=3077585 RepID=UPI0028E9D92E|nr:BCCT family transporter [Bacillus sp. DTU_2020_1000418_1_SI_GHA_SEK_038]WNS74838.1 BCCT family transporter [Bacillus sp. DTU_2020_1000418_1_SI_GHA_SEK_038]
MGKVRIDPMVFWTSLVVIFGATVMLVLNRKVAEPYLDSLMSSITYKMDWSFQFLTIGLFILLIWLAFSRYGKIKLGEGKPEFSNFSWGAMLFTAGMGTSIMYWSMMEPVYYFMGPPFGIEPESSEAAEWAVTYGLFHWGISAWALYAFPTVVIAYSYFVKKTPSLKMSVALSGALGKYANGWLAKLIDVLVIWSLVGGLGTSLGLGVPMMSSVVGEIFGIQESLGLNIVIVICITIIYSASAYLGLHKGIKRLADINVYMALALAIFVFLVGPTLFILSYFSNSFGLMLQNFLFMSFHTDPINKSGFPQGWTVFYWAWFAATAPFLGLFVAKISKGRTIRELITHVLLWGSIGGWIYFMVFGGYTMNLQLNDILPVKDILNEKGGPAAVVEILKSLPLSAIVLPFFLVLGIIFLSTSLDSATYIIAAIATKELRDDQDPARWHRMVWGAMLAVIAVSLMLIGGLRVIQTSAVIVSVPIFIIYLLLIVSLLRWLKKDFPKTEN